MFSWFPIINSSPGAIPTRTVLLGLAIVTLAFAPLGLLARYRPLAPLRIAIGIAVVGSLLGAMSLPAPLRSESVSSFVAFLLIVVLSVSAHLLADAKPRFAFAVLVSLGAIGVYFGYAVYWYATSPRWGATIKQSSWLVVVIASACLAACWHGRHLLIASLRSRPTPAL